MKVKVYFDNAEERYKIYNGDTVINATEVTINEIPIDEQLSDTSANAVENRTVKKALDDNKSYSQEIVGSLNEKVDANKSDSDNKVSTLRTDTELGLNVLNSRIDEVIGQGMRLIKGADFSWAWTGGDLIGNSNNFQLPANTVVFIAIPKKCIMNVVLNDDSIYTFGSYSATDTQVGIFATGSEITASDNFSLNVTLDDDLAEIRELVEANTTLFIADSPQELKDIRVDYYGFTHATAGDSVRSIMEAIKTGKVNINNTIEWTQTSTEYTGSATAETYLPSNIDINISLPAETVITIGDNELGDITATDTQELVFTTPNINANYSIVLSSNSLAYNDLINEVKLNIDFKIYIDKIIGQTPKADGFVLIDSDSNVGAHIGSQDIWQTQPYNKKYGWGGHPYGTGVLPPYSRIVGILEAQMLSVQGGKGRWNGDDTGNFEHGGHLFEGWNKEEDVRLTMGIGLNNKNIAWIQTFHPATESGTDNGTYYGITKVGSDIDGKGCNFMPSFTQPKNVVIIPTLPTTYTPTIPQDQFDLMVDSGEVHPSVAKAQDMMFVGGMYYDTTLDRVRVYTKNGWKTLAFEEEV